MFIIAIFLPKIIFLKPSILILKTLQIQYSGIYISEKKWKILGGRFVIKDFLYIQDFQGLLSVNGFDGGKYLSAHSGFRWETQKNLTYVVINQSLLGII